MYLSEMKHPLIVIVGPTCVGKTEVSVYLAEKYSGEIVSADSRTFYKGMDIGTAKPTEEEQQRIPHHLVDVVNPDHQLNLAVFQQKAKITIQEIYARNQIPFLVGGTGQYIRAVTKNWLPPSISPDPRLRHLLEKIADTKGKEFLYQSLIILDPEAAMLIDYRNLRRTIRALEVIFSTGVKFSSQRSSGTSSYDLIMIGLTRSRTELYTRIDRRIDDMFAKGFVEEVRLLLESGFSPSLPSFSAIGYTECINIISGKITEQEAVEQIKRKTRIYVRRQSNWFKPTDPDIHWFNISAQPLSEIEDFLRLALNS
jgi:tRNA dimethylallyltransferase